MKGLFINSLPALCSIYESGVMAYKALLSSDRYILSYADRPVDLDSYDFIVVNWHHGVCNWINAEYLKNYKGKTFCVVTEMYENNPIPFTPDIFNHYLVLDPSLKDNGKFHGFPRPIEILTDLPSTIESETGIPVIGSFGFLTRGKEWDLIVEGVCKDFDQAKIRFNIPFNTYQDGAVNMKTVVDLCKSKITKQEVTLEITHEDMSKDQLIRWCAQNTINVFFYRRDLSGLAAVTDQAVSAQRPILTTDDPTFRHLKSHISQHPFIGIKAAIEENANGILELYQKWHPKNFLAKFENILI